MKTASFEALKELLADYDLELRRMQDKYYIEYDEDVDTWIFNSLDEVRAFAAGIDYACMFVTA